MLLEKGGVLEALPEREQMTYLGEGSGCLGDWM